MQKALLCLKDYLCPQKDRFFIGDKNEISEISPAEIVEIGNLLVCHDYWLIAPSIYAQTRKLPVSVIDIEEFRVATTGKPAVRKSKEKYSIATLFSQAGLDGELAQKYQSIFDKEAEFSIEIYQAFAAALINYWDKLAEQARENDEIHRYIDLEVPVINYVMTSALAGIAVDADKLSSYKKEIQHNFYVALKKYSHKFEVPLEVPADADIAEYLEPRGFDISTESVNYVLDFLFTESEYASDVRKLRKLDASRYILASISHSDRYIFPLVECFGSITSRIFYRNPSLQNLAKRYRDILIPKPGNVFSYVDYDQFEAGIMAALSEDPILIDMYSTGDLYQAVAEQVFSNKGERKKAKRLFLSYAYGMQLGRLIDAAVANGAERSAAKKFFRRFGKLEEWKKGIISQFEESGAIGTNLGNYRRRETLGPLSSKEKRSAVSQVVQGTASLIFKRALLEISKIPDVELRLPMHDAVLIEHRVGFNPSIVADLMASVMSSTLDGKVKGKASVGHFTDT